jgi:hypothetical protein
VVVAVLYAGAWLLATRVRVLADRELSMGNPSHLTAAELQGR